MLAALFAEPNARLVIQDVDPIAPGPTDVVIDVGASGICHSDLAVITGARPLAAPAILGHEAAGRVVGTGSEVRGIDVGDRVVTTFIPACGQCWWCLHQQSNLCERAFNVAATPRATVSNGDRATAFLGIGGFAEQITVDESSVVVVRSDLPDQQLALLGCGVTTGMCAVFETARVAPGDTVVVIGCGGVGQAAIQAASIAGAAVIVAVDLVPMKRELALRFGASHAIDPATESSIDVVHDLTGGRGADFVFEATGNMTVARDGFELVRRGGALVMVGMPRFDAELRLPANQLFTQGKRIFASKFGDAQVRRDIQRIIDLAESGRIDLGAMVSREFSLDHVNEGIAALINGEVIRGVIV